MVLLVTSNYLIMLFFAFLGISKSKEKTSDIRRHETEQTQSLTSGPTWLLDPGHSASDQNSIPSREK